MSTATGRMTKIVMNSAKPVVTSAGGRSCIDIARFRNDSTTTMRVKHVIVITSAGAIDSSVISSTISMAVPTVPRSSPVCSDSVMPGPGSDVTGGGGPNGATGPAGSGDPAGDDWAGDWAGSTAPVSSTTSSSSSARISG